MATGNWQLATGAGARHYGVRRGGFAVCWAMVGFFGVWVVAVPLGCSPVGPVDPSPRVVAEPDLPNARAYINRGIAWQNKGDYDKAIADYNRAIELDPKNADSYSRRGDLRFRKDDYDQAIADYTRSIELNPKHSDSYNGRGQAWAGKGDWDKAFTDFNRAIKLCPEYAFYYSTRAWGWTLRGDCDKAIADYTRSIELNPDSYVEYYDRGVLYLGGGRFAEAEKDFKTGRSVGGFEDDGLWFNLVRRRAGQPGGKELGAYVAKYAEATSIWPRSVCAMFAGRIDPAKYLQSAEPKKPDLTEAKLSAADKTARQRAYEKLRRKRLCQAYYFVAQYELIAGRTDKARALLEKCVATKAVNFLEYTAAVAELKRMKAKSTK